MFTWATLYLFIKFWLPMVTALGLATKAFLLVRASVTGWANTLLDNHLTHLQGSAEKAAVAITELAEFHKETIQLQKDTLNEIREQRADIRGLTAKL